VLAALERLDHTIARGMGRFVGTEVEGLRGSQARMLELIGDGGTRPSALAEGSRITKQAVGQRIREMEERGWVTVTPDPSDGRAVLVRRTAAGDRVRRTIRQGVGRMEREWTDLVGADRYAVFRQVLDELGS
jgi:DNA-binding MarR family transcriptional regulator